MYNKSLFTMLKSVLVDYNPVAQLLNKLVTKVNVLAELADYLKELLYEYEDSALQKVLFLLGLAAMTYKTGHFVHEKIQTWGWIPSHFITKSKFSIEKFQETYGINCYVCITGFSDGIGKAYSELFAEYGYNLLLISRNKQKVQLRVNQLKKQYPKVDIKHIVSDLADLKQLKILEQQLKQYKDLDIGILINNAGTVAGGPYIAIKPQNIVQDINVDLCAIFTLNRILIPRMRAREQRSAIINISSCTGIYLSPRVGVYSSGKKTIDVFSRILALQNSDKIDIMSLSPFGVTTKMMKMKKGPFMITPRQCAIGSLPSLLAKHTHSFGHFKHCLSSTAFITLNEYQRFELFQRLWDAARLQAEP